MHYDRRMSAWIWLAVGFVLLAFELVTPGGFYILFFGVGALLTGAATVAGLTSGTAAQWLLFTCSSVVSLALFRGKLLARLEPPALGPVDTLVGEIATAVAPIPARGIGRVTLRGSSWEARNEGAAELAAEQRCRVVNVAGLQLGVVAES
jgi:membrane protein implicated in regulation of membrane protease activity